MCAPGTGEADVAEAESLLKPFRLRYPRVSHSPQLSFWILRLPGEGGQALHSGHQPFLIIIFFEKAVITNWRSGASKKASRLVIWCNAVLMKHCFVYVASTSRPAVLSRTLHQTSAKKCLLFNFSSLSLALFLSLSLDRVPFSSSLRAERRRSRGTLMRCAEREWRQPAD